MRFYLDEVEDNARVSKSPKDLVKMNSGGLVERVWSVHCGLGDEQDVRDKLSKFEWST